MSEIKIISEKNGITTWSCGCQCWTEGETKETRAFMLRACPKGRECEFVQICLASAQEMKKKGNYGIAIAEKVA